MCHSTHANYYALQRISSLDILVNTKQKRYTSSLLVLLCECFFPSFPLYYCLFVMVCVLCMVNEFVCKEQLSKVFKYHSVNLELALEWFEWCVKISSVHLCFRICARTRVCWCACVCVCCARRKFNTCIVHKQNKEISTHTAWLALTSITVSIIKSPFDELKDIKMFSFVGISSVDMQFYIF